MQTRTDLADLNQRYELNTRARTWLRDIRLLALGPHGRGFGELSEAYQKAAVAAHSTLNSFAVARLARPFLDLIPRLLNELPDTLSAPPFLPIPVATSTATAKFVGEGAKIPVVRADLDTVRLTPCKLALIGTFTEELLKATDERALRVFEAHLRTLITEGEEAALLSSDAAVPGERPAGLRFGITPIAMAGDLPATIIAMWTSVRGGKPRSPVFISSSAVAISLRGENATLFTDVLAKGGGSLFGVPHFVSEGADNNLILLDAASLAFVDEGLTIDHAWSGALDQNDAPAPGPSSLVSLLQTNSVGTKVIRYVDWALGHADAVGYVELPIDGSAR